MVSTQNPLTPDLTLQMWTTWVESQNAQTSKGGVGIAAPTQRETCCSIEGNNAPSGSSEQEPCMFALLLSCPLAARTEGAEQ